MPVKFWSPKGNMPDGSTHLALTSGHSFLVPHDKEGIDVPARFRREAIACGCIPVGMEPEDTKPDSFDRAAVIHRGAKRGVAHARVRDDPTHQPVAPGTAAADPEALARPETRDDAAAGAHAVGAKLRDRTADEIMRRLQQAGGAGLTRTDISAVFKRNLSAARIAAALELLLGNEQATCETIPPEGRPTELWRVSK
jgi:hypothetical protein